MTLTVNGSTCSAAFNAIYPNKPCVSVTICDSGGGNCQSIDDILLDTGDDGLRIFQSGPECRAAICPREWLESV